MIIGLIGFGKVCRNIVNLIKSDDIEFITSKENRSKTTCDSIDKAGVKVESSFRDVAIKSDLLISAASPASAIEIAEKYGKYVDGIYLDLNNISPQSTLKIEKHVNKFVDGAIIGKIDSKNPILYISGKNAEELLFLDDFLDVVVVSDKIGDVAILKLLRSTYTKTLSALLIESYQIAQDYNLENEFFDVISATEGDDFKNRSLSRIRNTLAYSKRKSEELNEIIECFSQNELIMVKAALDKFSRL